MSVVTSTPHSHALSDDTSGESEALRRGWAQFGSVDLLDLDADSALMTRTDRKYALTVREAVELQSVVSQSRIITVNSAVSSGYRSVYFDSPGLDAFHDAATSRRRRFKVRVRTYVDSEQSYLEVKTKNGRGQTRKVRCEHAGLGEFVLGEAEQGFVAQELSSAGIAQSERVVARLAPVLTTSYQRTTLLDPDGSRITWDTDLTCYDATAQANYPQLVLIETKSAGRTTLTDRALWEQGHRPVSISKFAAGMITLHPNLRSNKWHRVLRSRATLSDVLVK